MMTYLTKHAVTTCLTHQALRADAIVNQLADKMMRAPATQSPAYPAADRSGTTLRKERQSPHPLRYFPHRFPESHDAPFGFKFAADSDTHFSANTSAIILH
ncbi:hypothetical protein [Undibacterium sp. TJN19]|uniref:hypothetical protein n=1 Tax=Undibacterium sp. TJN19 TaxID=3413055 RepID=UPI003BF1E222